MKIFQIFLALLIFVEVSGQNPTADREGKYYQIKNIAIPEGVVLEVGGLAFDDKNRLGVSTRRGEIWLIESPESATPKFTRFAHGLHEPLGLAFRDGVFYANQRGELTKISDGNGDGLADRYEQVCNWELAANYHEYSYGPKFLPDGDMIVTLNLAWTGKGTSLAKWSGWMLRVGTDGKVTPMATGMRSPAGFGLNEAGDIFYAENQGDWVGSGRMTHVETGDFVGHPDGLKWTGEPDSPLQLRMEDITDTLGYSLYEYAKIIPALKAPSVWFPHTLMGISTSDILLIPDNQFGPFQNQLLVGDQGHSKIMRVFQEKVNGIYQGACFPFREGFSSGVLRLIWGPDKSLYVGMTSRGWASTGKKPYALERLVWNGKTPFEIKSIRAKSYGFELEFTEPADPGAASDPAAYTASDFTYKYHHSYGSPVVDMEDRVIRKIILNKDNTRASLYLDKLRPGYIYAINAPGVKNKYGIKLLHDVGYYTLNSIPDGAIRANADPQNNSMDEAAGGEVAANVKRITQMPASWSNGPDREITIKTIPGLKFDQEEITVKAGAKIKWVFENPDDMLHNLLVVKPGTADEVADLAIKLGLKGQEKNYVPDSEQVLYHTNILQPHSSEVIYFVAPAPGEYTYVCTFPGHAVMMRGKLVVTE
ncbi:plastocyanin/azurin family copper-binding protein [Fulvivirgaceae bacterium BMA12]|uniref:Plastocyanin/azurin family copper-binding protein n=1 Tax=Agaribacillus aureus TaxID=3051825 RepID=A0ABT8LGQ6_9BACT|nr:plastocyanin/azurin family copper-binding protein [Fulvivirgaceae bacterium BMA12]